MILSDQLLAHPRQAIAPQGGHIDLPLVVLDAGMGRLARAMVTVPLGHGPVSSNHPGTIGKRRGPGKRRAPEVTS
jgi:hypothetical protein